MRAPLNDGEWHKIIFVLNGNEIQVVENCHQLFKQTDYEIDLRYKKTELLHLKCPTYEVKFKIEFQEFRIQNFFLQMTPIGEILCGNRMRALPKRENASFTMN